MLCFSFFVLILLLRVVYLSFCWLALYCVFCRWFVWIADCMLFGMLFWVYFVDWA